MAPPHLTVIVPVKGGERVLAETLPSLVASDLPRERWELIVVDDGSTDATSLVAARYADVVVRLAGNSHGPSYARNRGAEVSRGDVLVFLDADVRVHRDTLRLFAELFEADPELGAAMGSYDDRPPGGVVSQFRNLLHHHVHHRNPGEAETFWAGCGAVRRDVFREVGGYDEWHYARPQIEDIELGRRIRMARHRILLRPDIQCTHLKRWTLWNFLTTDFRHRGVPWTWMLITEGATPGASTLNLRLSQRLAAAFAGLAALALVAAPVLRAWWPLTVLGLALAAVVALNWRFYALLARRNDAALLLAALPLHVAHYLVSGLSLVAGLVMSALFGEPQAEKDATALEEVGLATWPPGPARPHAGVWAEPG
ncbi:MAG TPA: glycosyltransferase family 2 protein [Longimicrobiales bacterium]